MRPEHIERAFVTDALVDEAWRAADGLAARAEEIERGASDPGAGLDALVRLYGDAGLLRLVTDRRFGGLHETMQATAICLVRERLGHVSPLAELAFAMQGLGSYPMTHCGGPVASRWLAEVVAGRAVAGFALTEEEAGSDLGGIATEARRDGDDYVLTGKKIFISNAPIADVYTLFAVTDPASERRRLSAFVVPASTSGLRATPMQVLGGHPIGEVVLDGARIPASHLLGELGHGLSVALATLHRFRPTVAAAAVGFAQRALDETLSHVQRRKQFGAPLAELAIVQSRVAEMACDVETARLLVYRAARAIDDGADRSDVARKGSMAKLIATEAAQRVIDTAVQLHGGRGVESGAVVARLYEDVRALRIYEGANDVQKLLIARELLR